MKKKIYVFILFVTIIVFPFYAYSSGYLKNKDYIKSPMKTDSQSNENSKQVIHLYRVILYSNINGKVIPVVSQNILLRSNNIYYGYFDGNNFIFQINNTALKKRQQINADIVIFVKNNGYGKIYNKFNPVMDVTTTKIIKIPIITPKLQTGKGIVVLKYIKTL